MFEIREMYTVDGDNVKKFSCVNGKYMLDGTTVEITENGDVLVISENYAPMKICLVFSHEFHKETLFLGDAVERGYGDLQWKACDENRSMPWYFLAYHDGKIQGFGVKTGCNSLCFWNVQKDSVTLTLDIRNGTNPVKLSSRTLKAATLVFYSAEKDAFEGALEFCSKMCEKPRLPKTPIYGGNDWYCNYSNSTFSNILQGAERVSECAKDIAVRPYMVIDDGWQLTRVNGYMGGPWRYANRKFGDMKKWQMPFMMSVLCRESGTDPSQRQNICRRNVCGKTDGKVKWDILTRHTPMFLSILQVKQRFSEIGDISC